LNRRQRRHRRQLKDASGETVKKERLFKSILSSSLFPLRSSVRVSSIRRFQPSSPSRPLALSPLFVAGDVGVVGIAGADGVAIVPFSSETGR